MSALNARSTALGVFFLVLRGSQKYLSLGLEHDRARETFVAGGFVGELSRLKDSYRGTESTSVNFYSHLALACFQPRLDAPQRVSARHTLKRLGWMQELEVLARG